MAAGMTICIHPAPFGATRPVASGGRIAAFALHLPLVQA
jgi:hypothetical protein